MKRWPLRSTFALFPALQLDQRLGIMRKSWQVFHDRSLLREYFWNIILPVLQPCSAVGSSAADSLLKLQDRVVSSGLQDHCYFFSWRCFRVQPYPSTILSGAIKMKSYSIYPLSGALHMPYVPARVTRSAMVAHRHSFAFPRWRTQYRRNFVPLPVSLWNDLSDPVLDRVGQAGFNSRVNAFLLA